MALMPVNTVYRAITRQALRLTVVTAVLCCSALLVGSRSPSELERVLAVGELNILARNGSTTYYEGRSGYTGFEYTLSKAFADKLGVELIINKTDSLANILDSLEQPA